MADLPAAHLRLVSPPFYSTGVDYFCTLIVKIGRRTEKHWGLIFKTMTTKAVHLDLLNSLDSEAFAFPLRKFISREVNSWSSDGQKFLWCWKRASRGLWGNGIRTPGKTFNFNFNPPSSPHFGDIWERENQSVRNALQVAVGHETMSEDVLNTVSGGWRNFQLQTFWVHFLRCV